MSDLSPVLKRLSSLTKGRCVSENNSLWTCHLKEDFVRGDAIMVMVDCSDNVVMVEYVPRHELQWLMDAYGD